MEPALPFDDSVLAPELLSAGDGMLRAFIPALFVNIYQVDVSRVSADEYLAWVR
jgi:hypothetical protein